MKNEILRENLNHLIKNYGFDVTYHLCWQLESEGCGSVSYIPTLLSLTTQYFHRSRWIYDAVERKMLDTWAPILNKSRTDMISLLSNLKVEVNGRRA